MQLLDKPMIASAILLFIASIILFLNLRLNEAKRTDYARKMAIAGLMRLATTVLLLLGLDLRMSCTVTSLVRS
jgi:hypothetical protein